MVGGGVGDVLALPGLAAAAEHDGRRHARELRRDARARAARPCSRRSAPAGRRASPRATAYSDPMRLAVIFAAALVVAPRRARRPPEHRQSSSPAARSAAIRLGETQRAGAARARPLATASAAAARPRRGTSRTARSTSTGSASSSRADASRPCTRSGSPRAGPGRRAWRSEPREAEVDANAGALFRSTCTGYDALVNDRKTTRTAYYILEREPLGLRPRARECESLSMIELADVQAAAERLRGVAHRTPVLTSRTLDGRRPAQYSSRRSASSAAARSSSAARTTRSRRSPRRIGRTA